MEIFVGKAFRISILSSVDSSQRNAAFFYVVYFERISQIRKPQQHASTKNARQELVLGEMKFVQGCFSLTAPHSAKTTEIMQH